MKAPKKMFARQLRLSRCGFDAQVTAAKRKEIIVVDQLTGKSWRERRKDIPNDAQAIAGVLAQIEDLKTT